MEGSLRQLDRHRWGRWLDSVDTRYIINHVVIIPSRKLERCDCWSPWGFPSNSFSFLDWIELGGVQVGRIAGRGSASSRVSWWCWYGMPVIVKLLSTSQPQCWTMASNYHNCKSNYCIRQVTLVSTCITHHMHILNGTGNLQVSLDVPAPIPMLPLPMTRMGFPMKTSHRSSKMERYWVSYD